MDGGSGLDQHLQPYHIKQYVFTHLAGYSHLSELIDIDITFCSLNMTVSRAGRLLSNPIPCVSYKALRQRCPVPVYPCDAPRKCKCSTKVPARRQKDAFPRQNAVIPL